MHDFVFAIGVFVFTVVGSAVTITLAVMIVKTWISWYLAFVELRKKHHGKTGTT